MKVFNYKYHNLSAGHHLLGLLLVIAGMMAFLTLLFQISMVSEERVILFGSIAILVGLTLIFTYEGIIINFSTKQEIEYLSVCGYRFGKWTKFPKVEQVKVVSKSIRSINTPNGISPTISYFEKQHTVFLYASSQGKPSHSFTYRKEEKARQIGIELAKNLKATLIS